MGETWAFAEIVFFDTKIVWTLDMRALTGLEEYLE